MSIPRFHENWLKFEQFAPARPEFAHGAESEHSQCPVPTAPPSPKPPACESFEAGLGI